MSRQRSLIFWPVQLRKDREHSWKHHARRSLTREVLGIIDILAAKNEQRFVFVQLNTLLDLCFKGLRKDSKHYSLDRLKHVLEELRSQHIVSRYFESDGRIGFIVAPHDSLCRSDGKTCILPDRSAWRGANETLVSREPDWKTKVKNAITEWQSKQHQCSTQNSTNTAPISALISAPISAPTGIINSTDYSTDYSTDQSLHDANFELLSESQKADSLANGLQFGGSSRVTGLAVEPKKPKKPYNRISQDEIRHHEKLFRKQLEEAEKQKQEQPQKQKQERAERTSSETKPSTVEATPTATPKSSDQEESTPKRKRPVLPRYEYEADKRQRELDEFVKEEKERGRQMGFEPCEDSINRSAADRESLGFTVKGEDGIWRKARNTNQ